MITSLNVVILQHIDITLDTVLQIKIIAPHTSKSDAGVKIERTFIVLLKNRIRRDNIGLHHF